MPDINASSKKTKPAAADATAKKGAAKSYNPSAMNDLVTVSTNVNKSWLANPGTTLQWITQPAFEMLVNNFAGAAALYQRTGSLRPSETLSLRQLDSSINMAVAQVKINIAAKFKKANAPAQYARYGIVKEANTYRLPRDRDSRKAALALMLSAINADGFAADPDYGNAFWTGVQANYTAAMLAASSTDENISADGATVRQMAAQIKKVMTALRFVLRGNNPDTYKTVFRSWGWIRQDY